MQFLDFSEAGFGLLVKRSAHQREQLCMPPDANEVYGIMIDKEFVEEEGSAICYPIVHWEGHVAERMCHPINVEPVRSHTLPTMALAEASEKQKP